MRRCVRPRPVRRGFTLLEMCLVLFIIALLMGAMMPAMESARVEQDLRKDAHELSLMVKTAMLRSSEQHRPYVIDVTSTAMSLHPLAAPATDTAPEADTASVSSASDADASLPAAAMEEVEMSRQLDASNRLLAPDPKKAHAWADMPPTSWVFEPGDLCPAPRVRLTRGKAWLEMSFNALTGNVEDEATYFP